MISTPPSPGPGSVTLPGGPVGTGGTIDPPTKAAYDVKDVFPANGQGSAKTCNAWKSKLQNLDQQYHRMDMAVNVAGMNKVAGQENSAVSQAEGAGCVVQYAN